MHASNAVSSSIAAREDALERSSTSQAPPKKETDDARYLKDAAGPTSYFSSAQYADEVARRVKRLILANGRKQIECFLQNADQRQLD